MLLTESIGLAPDLVKSLCLRLYLSWLRAHAISILIMHWLKHRDKQTWKWNETLVRLQKQSMWPCRRGPWRHLFS